MQDIHDIRPPVKIGYDPTVLWIAAAVLAGMAIILLVYFLFKKFWKRKRLSKDLKLLPAPLPAFETAIKELDLMAAGTGHDVRLFYFGLSAVLRKYISRSFHINCLEMTSKEFIAAASMLDMDQQIKRDLSGFTESSDPYKYSLIIAGRDMAVSDLETVRHIITLIERQIRQKAEDKSSIDDRDKSPMNNRLAAHSVPGGRT